MACDWVILVKISDLRSGLSTDCIDMNQLSEVKKQTIVRVGTGICA